ncbi:hypothetical protein [Streptomyces sp. NPDC093600]|uniref:hypothetical protein n=1 Tax=Streptomyces sp. NPDC093600 TaxID=3366047 RepID=UPI00382E71DE
MEDYAGRVLADRYRLPLPPSDAYEPVETRAFDTYSGQEVLVRQVPLPEVVDAEFLDAEFLDAEFVDGDAGGGSAAHPARGRASRRPADPAVRRAVEAAQAAARIPDHPRLDQVFDVFAEAGSLWIVSELVAARPLASLLAERPLTPYRAAEIGADVLTALRALHAHGWTHRNITPRTVLVCDDGRVVLTGLATGAAEEALCGYAPVPEPEEDDRRYTGGAELPGGAAGSAGAAEGPRVPAAAERPDRGTAVPVPVPGARARAEIEAAGPERPRTADESGAEPGTESDNPVVSPTTDVRAARAGAIAAYRAGARAAARLADTGPVPVRRSDPDLDARPDPGPHPDLDPYEDPDPYADPHPDPYAGPGPDLSPGDGPDRATAPVPARGLGPEPQWWSQAEDDEGDDAEDEGAGPPRALLTGRWSDGPHASRDGSGPIPAGGSGPAGGRGSGQVLPGSGRPALPAGYTPAQAPQAPHTAPVPAAPAPVPAPAVSHWDGPAPDADGPGHPYRGPATRLAGERARQTRIAVVGAVTERWAPEQAGPVHENWRLAPPIGPATDLWALGALLYRAVQGHAPYPEDNAAELVQLVCAEPPAFAEECGPLRPVVESLLRQDPTERPDFEEVRGWLRSLVRSAPEPDAGVGVVPLPSVDATRLPIVRRRGELVRRRRGGAAGGRHRQRKSKQPYLPPQPHGPAEPRRARGQDRRHEPRREFRQESRQEEFHEELPQRAPRAPRPVRSPAVSRSPRALGRTLLLVILLLLGGAVAYAVMFMPQEGGAGGQRAAGQPGGQSTVPSDPGPPKTTPSTQPTPGTKPSTKPGASTTPRPGATTPPAAGADLATGYSLRKDPEGFQVGVADGWRRSPINDAGQVRYIGGEFTLIVVPGRDTVQTHGADPMAYQRTKERELQPWRDSSWSSASGLRRIDVGRQAMAVGQFTWQDSTGREVFVRNLALIEGGRYHVVQVIGPETERDEVSEIYDQAVKAYRATR